MRSDSERDMRKAKSEGNCRARSVGGGRSVAAKGENGARRRGNGGERAMGALVGGDSPPWGGLSGKGW